MTDPQIPLTPAQREAMTPEQLETYDKLVEAFGPEELDPELVDFIETNEHGWTNLKHPYVIIVMFGPHHHKQANAQYRAKKAALPTAIEEKKWGTFIWLHERPWRFEALAIVRDQVDPETFWELFSDVWSDSENVFQCEDYLVDFLEVDAEGPRNMMDDNEHEAYAALPDTVAVYRGFQEEGTMNGRSWTTDRATAEFFANRFGFGGQIAVGTVKKDDIQAFLQGRKESEIIVRPENVTIQQVDVVNAK